MIMEIQTINKIEILGRIGMEPRVSTAGTTQIARFSVATNEVYRDKTGTIREDTTWHNVAVWQGKTVNSFDGLRKGVWVHIVGRIRNAKYKDVQGEDKFFSEVVATQIKVCDPHEEC